MCEINFQAFPRVLGDFAPFWLLKSPVLLVSRCQPLECTSAKPWGVTFCSNKNRWYIP